MAQLRASIGFALPRSDPKHSEMRQAYQNERAEREERRIDGEELNIVELFQVLLVVLRNVLNVQLVKNQVFELSEIRCAFLEILLYFLFD